MGLLNVETHLNSTKGSALKFSSLASPGLADYTLTCWAGLLVQIRQLFRCKSAPAHQASEAKYADRERAAENNQPLFGSERRQTQIRGETFQRGWAGPPRRTCRKRVSISKLSSKEVYCTNALL